jgi:hypothetical protein
MRTISFSSLYMHENIPYEIKFYICYISMTQNVRRIDFLSDCILFIYQYQMALSSSRYEVNIKAKPSVIASLVYLRMVQYDNVHQYLTFLKCTDFLTLAGEVTQYTLQFAKKLEIFKKAKHLQQLDMKVCRSKFRISTYILRMTSRATYQNIFPEVTEKP